MRFYGIFSCAALCAVLAGCAHTAANVAAQSPIDWTAQHGKRVVLIDPDVELSELTAGGVTEARADWTATGKDFIRTDIVADLSKKSIATISADTLGDPHDIQLIKLHGAVGIAILQNTFLGFPTKKNNFDWTLGSGVQALGGRYQADYALFVYVRDSYTSAGRAALMIGAALLGVGIPGGQQTGFASLVDLRTGQVVWFNQLASSVGSLKEAKGADDTVTHLLNGLPL